MRRAFSFALALLLLLLQTPAALGEEAQSAQLITSAREFLDFAENCSRERYSLGKRFVLTNDIDLSGLRYEPAGYFVGDFDGGGHCVSGLSLETEGSRLGLFRQIGPGGTVENLRVEGRVRPGGSAEYIGGLAGVNEGTIKNCGFSGDVRGINNVGGLVGWNGSGGQISRSDFNGFLIGEHQAGGIAGKNDGVVSDCMSRGEVNAVSITPSGERRFDLAAFSQDDFVDLSNIGGVAGENNGLISFSENRASVGYSYTGYNVGGITGKNSGYLNACTNSGPVKGRRDVGGIAGQAVPYAAWELSNGKLEELRQAISYMQLLLGNLNQNSQDASDALRASLNSIDLNSDLALSSITDILRDSIDSSRTFLDGISIDPSTHEIHIPEVSIRPVDMSTFNGAIYNLYLQSGTLAETAKNSVGTFAEDLRGLSNQMGYIFNLLLAVVDDSEGGLIVTRDLSLEEAYAHNDSAIDRCFNRADVYGEINVGGVLGTAGFEIAFDMEDQLNSGELLATHIEQFLFCAVRACKSGASVGSRSDNAGGIVGRLDTGAVVDCVATGRIVSQSGGCVGGIAGTAQGSLARCWARASLDGTKHLGGIAGKGQDLLDCRAWAHMERSAEYRGAIAGEALGTVSGNLYVDSRPDGVDGVSRIGQAEPVSLNAFLALEGAPPHFDTVTVRFIVGGTTVQTLELPFGGTPESLPEVEGLGRSYWVWENYDGGPVYSDIEVSGEYRTPDSTLSSGEAVPLFLVEGEFLEGQRLRVLPFTPQGESIDFLSGYTLTVDGFEGTLTARMRSEEPLRLYRLSGGEWTELPAERDGRYLVFSLPNGASFAAAGAEESTLPRLAVVGGVSALLLTLILIGLRKRRRKTASRRTA